MGIKEPRRTERPTSNGKTIVKKKGGAAIESNIQSTLQLIVD